MGSDVGGTHAEAQYQSDLCFEECSLFVEFMATAAVVD